MDIAADQGTALRADLRARGEERTSRRAGEAVQARRIVYAATAGYAGLFVAATVLHFLAFRYARLDLGNMVQAVWASAHGHLLQVTTPTGASVSRLGAHVDPFLVLLVPLWWVWPSPLLLLVVQAVGVAAGALPVYWLARKHLGSERAAAHFAFAYLLFPATQYNAFTPAAGFHAVSLAVPLLLYAIWFLDEGRLLPFALVALLAATTKEEIPAAIACLGLWYAIRKGKRLAGGAIFVAGIGASLVAFLLVIPHFSPSGASPLAGRYGEVGGSLGGMAHTLVTNPIAFVHAVATWHKLVYVVVLLLPFLGLWLLEPLLFLGAVPDLAVNLLSSKPEQTTIQFQYTAGIVPFLIAASILGAAKLKGRDMDRVSFYALAGAALLALYSPIYFARGDVRDVLAGSPERSAKQHALQLIPPAVPVSASSQLAASLSARRRISVFPYIRDARWIVVDRGDSTYGDAAFYRRALDRIESRPGWTVVFRERGVEVLRRGSTVTP